MATLTRDSVDSYVQTYAGAGLRSFDKTMAFTITAYIRVYGTDNTYGAVMAAQNGPSSSGTYYQRFEYVNANDTLFNGYYDGGISAGSRAYAQDIVDTIEDAVRRAVDLVEGRIGNRSVSALLCHNSCHSSCHTSRGRR
jgi:hypothetical protein